MSQFDYIYGFHVIDALLDAQPELIVEITALREREDARLQALLTKANQRHIPFNRIDRAHFKQNFPVGSTQGIAARCHAFAGMSETVLQDIVKKTTARQLILVLDGVQDPHNLGACLRSANGFGVDAVVTTKDRACHLTPVVRKVACGAAESTPFIQVVNLARTLEWLQKEGIWIVGMTGDTEKRLQDIDLTMNLAIVLGNEGKGMRQLTRNHCDYLAKIPMRGSVESFNVSVATAVSLYEVLRQRG